MQKRENKAIAIVGTTASGKTNLAVHLALKFKGEVVSADSRQVYKYMDIGSGKDLDEYAIENQGRKIHVPYHMIDVVDPKTEYNLGKFYADANKVIDRLFENGKVPIIAGGTGLWAQALVDGYQLNAVKPDRQLRRRLEEMTADRLFKRLRRLDRGYADRLNQSERHNKRRLIRYLEVRLKGGEPANVRSRAKAKFKSLVLGITWPNGELRRRINARLLQRLENENLVGEVKMLHSKHQVSWKRLRSFGLEYKYVSEYLTGNMNYEDMAIELTNASYQFSRRQLTWLRRWEKQGRKIYWVKGRAEAEKFVKEFLKK